MLVITELDMLYQEAYDNNIVVVNAHFSQTKKAACLCGESNNIVLDVPKMDSSVEECEKLAHELTHIKSGSLYFITATMNTPLESANRQKHEANTTRETTLALLPYEKLQRAIYEEGFDYWRIAEYCGRTVKFVQTAFEIYENMGIRFDIPEY